MQVVWQPTNCAHSDPQLIGVFQYICQNIDIPESLWQHFCIRTTSLGGVFLHFCSVPEVWKRDNLAWHNAKVNMRFNFQYTDGAGRYIGEMSGLEVDSIGMVKPVKVMRGNRTPISLDKSVARVNKWIAENEQMFLQLCNI